jgi:hypothetical protein
VLAYGLRHGYADLCNEAAPKTVGTSAQDALTALNLSTFAYWVLILSCIRNRATHLIVSKVLYREHWLDILNKLHADAPPYVYHRGGAPTCAAWAEFQKGIMASFGAIPARLLEVECRFEQEEGYLNGCKHCTIRAQNWKRNILTSIHSIPKFSTIRLG